MAQNVGLEFKPHYHKKKGSGKMRPIETIPGFQEWGEGKMKENERGCEFDCDIRTFVNVTMYPQYNNNMIIKNKKKYTHIQKCISKQLV
jgi:hypothetical protein